MDASFNQIAKQSAASNKLLIWALACSILLHLFIAVVVPAFTFEQKKTEKPQELKIELVQPKAPEPVIIPEPPKPIVEPEPEIVKPKPIKEKVVKKISPKPVAEPIAELEPPQPVQETQPPPVIAAAPTVAKEPTIVVPEPPPPPPPEKPTGPSEGDINAAKNAYKNKVQNELKRYQQYPKLAKQRGIQGNVDLKISLNEQGQMTDVTVVESSGNSSLDNSAMEAVRKANIKQYMPEILRGRIDQIIVTLSFKLVE